MDGKTTITNSKKSVKLTSMIIKSNQVTSIMGGLDKVDREEQLHPAD